ncbi:MAG: cysteine desulfurase family protein [Nitrospiraceae bacterium]|nr:cysteine desulfurase family protein [Nitrospiraceae bacterium]
MIPVIYLDNNATTPADPEVYDAVFSSLKRDIGNPSSSHLTGRKARETIEHGRQEVADLLGCGVDEIYFTSGGTEANNLALLGSALRHGKGHIVTSGIEHPSVLLACRHLESQGFEVTYARVDPNGVVKVDEIADAVRKDTFLMSVMHANNETGVLQPIEEIGAIAKSHGIAFHVDAAQSIGKTPFRLEDTAIDFMTVVGHKFYGPKGVGALYVRGGRPLDPILYGGGHERGLRPGTENVAGIAGFGKACQLAKRDIRLRVSLTLRLRELLFEQLKSLIPGLRLNGHPSQRLPNTLNVCLPGVPSRLLAERLSDAVALSTGSACHAGETTPSAVLLAMGLSEKDALTSVRLSVGKDNTEEEILKAVSLIAAAADALRQRPS